MMPVASMQRPKDEMCVSGDSVRGSIFIGSIRRWTLGPVMPAYKSTAGTHPRRGEVELGEYCTILRYRLSYLRVQLWKGELSELFVVSIAGLVVVGKGALDWSVKRRGCVE